MYALNSTPASAAAIDLFADGSFQHLIESGAWAFSVPRSGWKVPECVRRRVWTTSN